MKKFSILFTSLFLFQNVSFALEIIPKSLDLLCITGFPTTSFVGETTEGQFHFRLVNSNGVRYMPIHAGLVTIEDLKQLESKAAVLKHLGEVSEFSFDVKSCTVFGDGTFRCQNGSVFETESGKKFEAYSLRSSLIKSASNDQKIDEIQISLMLIVDNESLFVTMNYDVLECGIAFN